jgi:outer membrane lipoprotein
VKKFQLLLLFFLVFLISGCAHVVSKSLREQADRTLTFQQVLQDPSAFKGRIVIWGGEIIETANQRDGTTRVEVFQRPLGWGDEPKDTVASEGRFLALANKYLDPYIFRKGRKVTVAGELLGEETGPIGEMEYRYPLLLTKAIYLWEEYYYYPAPYSPYYPWWGYPYGWGPSPGW